MTTDLKRDCSNFSTSRLSVLTAPLPWPRRRGIRLAFPILPAVRAWEIPVMRLGETLIAPDSRRPVFLRGKLHIRVPGGGKRAPARGIKSTEYLKSEPASKWIQGELRFSGGMQSIPTFVEPSAV